MDIISIIAATLGSGLIATVITLVVQKKSENKRVKVSVFEVLMSHRYLIADKENVEALNKVDVVFHDDAEVRKAWTEFLNAADAGALNLGQANAINDKYLKLLEKIAKSIGYNNIDWENIKRYYYPTGLSSKISEETLLRKAQLSQIKTAATQDSSTGQLSKEQLGIQLFLKALETPDGLDKVMRLAEIAGSGKNGKGRVIK